VLIVHDNSDADGVEDRLRGGEVVIGRAAAGAIAVAPRAIAEGVFVIARINRAWPVGCMLERRMPAAREITSLPVSAPDVSCRTGRTTDGLTPIRIISAARATSMLSAVTAMPVSARNSARKSSTGWLAMISSGAQYFFSNKPRMTEPASLPAPITPSR
jgi:hypothetical protein